MMTPDPEAMPSEAEELWSRLREQLRWTMTKETFDLLLLGSEGVALQGHSLTVEVRKPQALPWLNARLKASILRTVHKLADPELEIVFSAQEEEGDDEDVEDDGNGDGQPELPQEPSVPHADGAPPGGSAPAKAAGERRSLSGAEPPFTWTDYYIKFKLAFRKSALSTLKGAPLSVFLCLALHMNKRGRACVGIEVIMKETGYSRRPVCAALDELQSLHLISKRVTRREGQHYCLLGYAWMGQKPAPALFEAGEMQGQEKDGSGK